MDPRLFLKRLWIGLSTIGTLISIASLFDDAVAWVAFIRSTIIAYREIVDVIWGPLLRLLPFHLPRWTHDYLTVSALTGVSILWSLHNTAHTLGFPRMGSPLTVFRHVFLDFSVGGNTLALFRSEAMDAASKLGLNADQEIQNAINKIARPERYIVDGIAACFLFVILVVIAPFLIPSLMRNRDALDLRRAERLFQRRMGEISTLSVEPSLKSQWRDSLADRAAAFANFGEINALFYRMVRNNMLAYYAVVAVVFTIIVLANYAIHRIGESEAKH